MSEIERIKKLMDENNLVAKKSFGQNFLINEKIIQEIVNSLNLTIESQVIEIGPGLGGLTLPLSNICKHLVAVDSDRDMVNVLNKIFKDNNHVSIVQSDFLKFNPNSYMDKYERIFVGNLPYNITSQLLEYLLQQGFFKAGVMVQKEVADKLTYIPNKKENCPLGLMIKAQGEIVERIDVDSSSFLPAPKVDSSFIVIEHRKDIDFSLYFVFKALFKDSNKTILNCLRQSQYRDSIDFIKDSPFFDVLSKRARQLEADKLVNLSEFIKKNTKKN